MFAVVSQAAQGTQRGWRKHRSFLSSLEHTTTQDETTAAVPKGLKAETALQLGCDAQEEP